MAAAKRKAATASDRKIKMVKVPDPNAPGGFKMVNEEAAGSEMPETAAPSRSRTKRSKKPKPGSIASKGGSPAND